MWGRDYLRTRQRIVLATNITARNPRGRPSTLGKQRWGHFWLTRCVKRSGGRAKVHGLPHLPEWRWVEFSIRQIRSDEKYRGCLLVFTDQEDTTTQ